MGRSLSFFLMMGMIILVCTTCLNEKRRYSAFYFPSNISSNGKLLDAPRLEKTYNLTDIGKKQSPSFNLGMVSAVRQQRKLLEIQRRGRKNFNIGGLKFGKEDLMRTVDALEKWGSSALVPPSEYFDTYMISGKDQRGNMFFTGYYSPVLSVRKKPDGVYQFPIYTKPKGEGPYPTRKEIYQENALEGKDLELAYAKSLLDIQSMQLQGSGFVRYGDGSLQLLSYGGTNRHPRKSIQRYYLNKYGEPGEGVTLRKLKKIFSEYPELEDEIIFHNPSYVFFIKNEVRKRVNGSGNVPLKPFISIATDRKYIPTGACLFALRPSPLKNGVEHIPSVLLAQDVGGGIKGAGHIDLYTGIGKEGLEKAALGHYGTLWLLLAK